MDSISVVILTMVLLMAVVMDLHSSRIPNWLTFSGMGFALAGHAWLNNMDGVLFSLAGLGTGLGLFFLFYLAGAIGAGDVKLMAAVGAMVGPFGALISGGLAILVGGAYAAGVLAYRSCLTRFGWGQEAVSLRLRYGLAIAGGTLLFQLGINPFGG